MKKPAKNFIINIIAGKSTYSVEKIAKKIFKGFTDKQRKKRNGYLHCYYEDESTRKKLLSLVANAEIQVFCVFLNKEKNSIGKDWEKHILYNHITNALIGRYFTQREKNNEYTLLTASKWESNKSHNLAFLEDIYKNMKFNTLQVQIKSPHEDNGLQIVDFVSWAIFRNLEYNDASYTDIFKDKIVELSSL